MSTTDAATNYVGLPPTVRIGAFEIPFVMLPPRGTEDDSWGECYPGQRIELRRGQPSPEFAVDTLLHEIGHALYDWFDLENADEERTTKTLAGGWTMVFKHNPDLIEWIQNALNERSPTSPLQ